LTNMIAHYSSHNIYCLQPMDYNPATGWFCAGGKSCAVWMLWYLGSGYMPWMEWGGTEWEGTEVFAGATSYSRLESL